MRRTLAVVLILMPVIGGSAGAALAGNDHLWDALPCDYHEGDEALNEWVCAPWTPIERGWDIWWEGTTPRLIVLDSQAEWDEFCGIDGASCRRPVDFETHFAVAAIAPYCLAAGSFAEVVSVANARGTDAYAVTFYTSAPIVCGGGDMPSQGYLLVEVERMGRGAPVVVGEQMPDL